VAGAKQFALGKNEFFGVRKRIPTRSQGHRGSRLTSPLAFPSFEPFFEPSFSFLMFNNYAPAADDIVTLKLLGRPSAYILLSLVSNYV